MLTNNAQLISLPTEYRAAIKERDGSITDRQIDRALEGLSNIRSGLEGSNAVEEFGTAFLQIFTDYTADMVLSIIQGSNA